MVEVTQDDIQESPEMAALAAQDAVDMFHTQVQLDPNAHPEFKTMVTTHPLFNCHRSTNEEAQSYAMYFNSAFMAADLYGITGEAVASCYKRPMPTEAEINNIEKALTTTPLINIHLAAYETPTKSQLPAFFCCASKSEQAASYELVIIPDLPATPSVAFRMTVNSKSVQGIQMQLVDGVIQSNELNPTPSGIIALTRGAMVALDLIGAKAL